MKLFKKNKKKCVCSIGLDGVPFGLLKELAEADVMPAVAALLEQGHLQSMKASLPEISSVSWTNFMTGSNPGTHGIFGFTDLKPRSYDMRFPNFLDVKTPTFWDTLGALGKKSVIINQPSTYPARKIPGVLISGFVAIEMAKAVYPMSLKPDLENLGYEIDIDTYRCRENPDLLWAQLHRTLKGREKAWEYLWKQDWDYLEFVVTGTDRLHHFLWEAYRDKSHDFHQNFLDYYNAVDRVIGRIVAAFEQRNQGLTGLYLLSDHGFTGIEQEVYLNAWLKREGYLRFSSPEPKGLAEILPESKAFAMDPNRIYLHQKDRYPQGTVEIPDREGLKSEISKKLRDLEYKGKKVVREVFDTSDIYSGPQVGSGPDLIVLGEHGFDMKGSIKKDEIFGRTSLQGMHTWDDAFFWSLTEQQTDLTIADLAGIIMANFQ